MSDQIRNHRALILAPFSYSELRKLRLHVKTVYESWTETRRLWDPNELAERLVQDSITILIIESDFIFEEVFESAANLQFLGVCRSTTSHVDSESATKHGVLVVNTPGRNDQAVAEHAIGLMLSLARRIPAAHNYIIDRKWQDPTEPYIDMRGIELANRTLGLIGVGAIGRRLASIADSIGMKCVGYDPYAFRMPRFIETTCLEKLLSSSDFIAINTPLTHETKGMIGSEQLALMNPSSYLINLSNTEIVSEESLVSALRGGKLAGAALDVFKTHPIEPSSPLLSLDNVVLTPHIGGATYETIQRHSNMMRKEIDRFINGKEPNNLVNPRVWTKYE